MANKKKTVHPKKGAVQKSADIVPMGDRVVARPIKEEHTATQSGIIIPDTASKERPEMGVVIAVGEGKRTDDGTILPPRVSVGDTILFTKYGPDEITIDDDEEYIVVSESNILAVIK